MAESLNDFLNPVEKSKYADVSGSLACTECNEIVHSGKLNEDDIILRYRCSKNHESRIKL